MLELPESHNIADQLNETIKGKTIQNVWAGQTPHGFAFYNMSPEEYQQFLGGRKIDRVVPVAGQVEIQAGDARLNFNDGINIRFLEEGKAPPKKHQLLVEFEDLTAIVCTVQMYGGMMAFSDGTYDNPYYLVAKEKPTPLTDAFDQAYFDGIVRSAKKNLSVKALLATEQRIPGLGNGVLQDILFKAGLHPKRKLSTLSDAEEEGMFRSVKETLCDMTARGGRDTEKDLFGCYGGYKSILSKNTLKEPCPVCGDALVRQAYLGGNIYFCPTCQPLD